jgi:hypothetical protein
MNKKDIKYIKGCPGIYTIINKVIGSVYKGVTLNLKKKLSKVIDNYYTQRFDIDLYKDFDKYNIENFDINIVKEVTLYPDKESLLKELNNELSSIEGKVIEDFQAVRERRQHPRPNTKSAPSFPTAWNPKYRVFNVKTLGLSFFDSLKDIENKLNVTINNIDSLVGDKYIIAENNH